MIGDDTAGTANSLRPPETVFAQETLILLRLQNCQFCVIPDSQPKAA